MSYIGNTSTTQAFTPAVDYFSGNASTTTFTLSKTIASVAQVQVTVANVPQNPSSAYTISGQTITFTSAPPSGTNNIYVYYTSPITQVIAPGQGTVTTTSLASSTGTGAVVLATSPTITTPTVSGDATISGLTVGKGGGAVAGNTVLGSNANASNTTASTTTAIGFYALNANLTGANNTAVGQYAAQNTTASNNTAIGQGALTTNSSGGNNTAIGNSALNANTTASNNTAVGYTAGYTNSTGTNNTFIGYGAGNTSNAASTTGYNTAVGAYAGYSLTTGVKNTFIGSFQSGGTAGSGSAITTGSANSILGAYTGNGSGLDIRTSSNYIVLSDGDGTPRLIVDNNGKILLGGVTSAYAGNGISISSSQNTIWTNCTVQGQNGLVVQNSANSTGSVANLVAFNVGTAGGGTTIGSINYSGTTTLYNATSDQRLKENIVDSETALTTLSQIKIRAFDWIDSKIHETHGVIAQELNEIAPQCVTEGVNHEDGSIDRPWQVDTSPLVPMLIKAIQEQQATINALTARIEALENK